jgi:AraC-like DNA-binding protein
MNPAFKGNPRLEPVPATKYRSFECKCFAKPKFDFIWHHHPEVELTYILHGHGVRYVGNSIQPFHAGDLCLIGADVPHAYGSHPKMRGGAKWLVLHFLPERFGAEFWRFPDTRTLRKLLESSRCGIGFHGRGTEKCVQLLQKLDRRNSSLEGLANFLRVLDSLSFIQHKTKLIPWRAAEPDRPHIDPRLQKVLAWLESADQTAITQGGAARLVHMSSAAFSRFFRNQTGRTFVRHVNELRIARACVSLAVEDRRITEISLESGFGNLSNFNRRFREIVGMPPREYQASLPAKAGGA